jgi:hypothetical protein
MTFGLPRAPLERKPFDFRRIVRPPRTGWTWDNQSTATATFNPDGSIWLVSAANFNNHSVLHRPAPAPPYSLVVLMRVMMYSNFAQCTVSWRQASNGYLSMASFTADAGVTLQHQQWTAAVGGFSGTQKNSPHSTMGPGDFQWIRLRDDGTNRHIDFSPNGLNWLNFHTVARTTFLTPDQIALTVRPNTSNHLAALLLMSWEVTPGIAA